MTITTVSPPPLLAPAVLEVRRQDDQAEWRVVLPTLRVTR
jgi:hypothetical protein